MVNWLMKKKFNLLTKKKTKEEIQAEEQKDVQKRTNRSKEELDLLPNPLEKLLKLERIIQKIDQRIAKKETELSIEANGKGARVGMLSTGMLAVAGILLVTTSGGILMPAMLGVAGIVGLVHFAPKATTSAKKRLESENSKLMSLLNNQKTTFIDLEANVIEKNLTTIASAAVHNANLSFDRHHIITTAFAKVAAEKIAGSDPEVLETVSFKSDNNSLKP